MLFLASLNLYKILNQDLISLEIVTVLNQMICIKRQTSFEIIRDNNCKIGMNWP